MSFQPLSSFACDQGVDGDTEPEVFQDVPYVLLHITVSSCYRSRAMCVQLDKPAGDSGLECFPCGTGGRACGMAGERHP